MKRRELNNADMEGFPASTLIQQLPLLTQSLSAPLEQGILLAVPETASTAFLWNTAIAPDGFPPVSQTRTTPSPNPADGVQLGASRQSSPVRETSGIVSYIGQDSLDHDSMAHGDRPRPINSFLRYNQSYAYEPLIILTQP